MPAAGEKKRAASRLKASISLVLDDVAGHLLQARLSVLAVPAARPASLVREPQPEVVVSHWQQL